MTHSLPIHESPPLSAAELVRLDAQFPLALVEVGDGCEVAVRTAGAGEQLLVCLHGIGSGAASWLNLAQCLPRGVRLIAWDAPGYGLSTPLAAASPRAMDYARRLDGMLRALDIRRCTLVGHSLGALPSSAFVRNLAGGRVSSLVLLSPAQGYGRTGREAQGAAMRDERLAQLADGGIAGMAARRYGRLLSRYASQNDHQWVRWNMARMNDGGYRQAIDLLCHDDLMSYLPPPRGVHVSVACGALDTITAPDACAEVARACGVALHQIPNAGHACYVEQSRTTFMVLQSALGGHVPPMPAHSGEFHEQ